MKFLLTFIVLTSFSAMAQTRLEKTCIGDAAASSDEVILVEKVIDGNTGLPVHFLTSTTYLDIKYCKQNIKQAQIEAPTFPENSDTPLVTQTKCYKDLLAKGYEEIYLVEESRNPETGVVVAFEIKNVFDEAKYCQSWLNQSASL